MGWSSTQGGEAGAVAFAAGTVNVYPVIKTGYWVIFDSKGGNYVAPVFAQDGQTVTLPTTATRPGYTFDGWYQNGQPVTQVNAAANLEAHWTAAKNTKYTVIHWQENANDDEYSLNPRPVPPVRRRMPKPRAIMDSRPRPLPRRPSPVTAAPL